MKLSRFIVLMAGIWLALGMHPAMAQFASLKSDPLFRIIPPFGHSRVQKGMVEYTIGAGAVRALFRYREVAIKVMQGERELQSIPVDRLPTRFQWDTSYFPDGSYQIRVVVTEKDGQVTIADYVRADVANGPPFVEQIPVSPAPLPHPRWNKTGIEKKLPRGAITLPTLGWPLPSAPETMLPALYIFKENLLMDSVTSPPNPEGGERQFSVDTTGWQDGTYRFVLMSVDLSINDREEVCDEFTVTLGETRPKVRPGLAPLPGRDQWIPRDKPAGIGEFPTYEPGASRMEIEAVKKKRFEWVLTVARRVGDPHPEVCAAQFALESGWGEHLSGVNNVLGIKARPGEDATFKGTQEWTGSGQPYAKGDFFKNYPSVYHCIVDRVQRVLRRSHYNRYWTARGTKEAIFGLGPYSTDPNYFAQLKDILQRLGRPI